jgi:hypothetical protein
MTRTPHSDELMGAADSVFHINSRSFLQGVQLPSPVRSLSGFNLLKPNAWVVST